MKNDYLLYASDEMYSSTELIRKSKNIFDKLSRQEISKAVILRDGKPKFMMLEFSQYEKIMKEFTALRQKHSSNPSQQTQKEKLESQTKDTLLEDIHKNISNKEIDKEKDEVEVKVQEDTLAKEDTDNQSVHEKNEQLLKEFWE